MSWEIVITLKKKRHDGAVITIKQPNLLVYISIRILPRHSRDFAFTVKKPHSLKMLLLNSLTQQEIQNQFGLKWFQKIKQTDFVAPSILYKCSADFIGLRHIWKASFCVKFAVSIMSTNINFIHGSNIGSTGFLSLPWQ